MVPLSVNKTPKSSQYNNQFFMDTKSIVTLPKLIAQKYRLFRYEY